MLNQKNAWNLIAIGQYGTWKFQKPGKNDAQNLISSKTVLMEAVQKIEHLPNNTRNILWKFELEMFCWTLDICRSVFSTFSVPRPYYHAECEYFSYFSLYLLVHLPNSRGNLSLILFVMISQFLLNSEVVEHIVFMRKAGLYGILLSLRDLGWFDCACKYVCWSVGLWNIVVWILCFWSLYNLVYRNSICLVDIL